VLPGSYARFDPQGKAAALGNLIAFVGSFDGVNDLTDAEGMRGTYALRLLPEGRPLEPPRELLKDIPPNGTPCPIRPSRLHKQEAPPSSLRTAAPRLTSLPIR
jgi:hypothetical protein